MVVCKYYLQGTCRFGTRCRFEHTNDNYSSSDAGRGYRRSNNGYASSGQQGYSDSYNAPSYRSPLSGSSDANPGSNNYRNKFDDYTGNYQTAQHRGANQRNYTDHSHQHQESYAYNQNRSNQFNSTIHRNAQPGRGGARSDRSEIAELFSTISEEMTLWEPSGMWPFSCFAFLRETCSLPGLDDISMEEVRFQAYEAKAVGKFTDYIAWFSAMKQEYAVKRQQLINPNDLIKSAMIQQLHDLQVQEHSGTGSGTAAGQRYSADCVSFAASNSLIAAVHHNGAFGVFGTGGFTPVASPFGQQQQLGSVNDALYSYPSVAVNPLSAVSSLDTVPSFGGAYVPNTNVIGVGHGQSNVVTSGFSTAAPADIGIATTQGRTMTVGQQQQQAGSTGMLEIYTLVDQLTNEDKIQFESVKFTLGHVPVKPPPQCYV